MPTLRLAALLGLILALVALPAEASAAEPARSANAFVQSIGLNVHMTYSDTAYVDRPLLIRKLQEAGIRHVRDGLSRAEFSFESYNDMAAKGIHTTFIMGDPTERRDTLEQLLSVLKTRVRPAAEAVEGPNEYSNSGDPRWATDLRAYQTRLYRAIKRDPALAKLPVLAPSVITPQNHTDLGKLNSLDFGNKHIYASGDPPEANVDWEVSQAAHVSGGRPVWVTETGYHNALATDSGHRPTSEAAAGVYIPRMFLEYFRRGIPRTYSYELIDEWPDPAKRYHESHFGLLRNDYSEKPAFRALSNLISVLSDAGPAHPVRPLDLTIGGPSDLRRLLLQKRDGSYALVLWRASQVWDPIGRRPVGADTESVTIRVGGPAARTLQRADLIDPATAAQPFKTASLSGGMRVSVGPNPLVVNLRGGTSPGPGTGSGPGPTKPKPKPTKRPPFRVTIPGGQRLGGVLRLGLRVDCRSAGGDTCSATAARGTAPMASGRGIVPQTGSVRLTVRPTARGRRLLRRAVDQHRPVRLRVRTAVTGGRSVARLVVVRP